MAAPAPYSSSPCAANVPVVATAVKEAETLLSSSSSHDRKAIETATAVKEGVIEEEKQEADQDIKDQVDGDSSHTLKRKRQHDDDDEKAGVGGDGIGVKEEEEQDDNDDANANCCDGDKKHNPHPLWKTSLCSYFRRSAASCSHGSACRYAHGEAELRPRPDNSWDPTSEKGKSTSNIMKKPLPDHCDLSSEMELDISLPPVQDVLACSDDDDRSDAPTGDRPSGRLHKCIIGLPMKWTSEKLQAFLDNLGIFCNTVRKKKGMTVGFIGFEDEAQLKSAIGELSGKSIGGKDIKIADVIPRSYVKKAKNQVPVDEFPLDAADNSDSVDCHAGDSALRTRSARDTVAPLAHMPYEEQLEYKKNSLIQILKRLTRNARKACPGSIPLPEWIHKSREIGGLPCELEGILPSPSISGYRNKCEFTVGYSLHGKKTVGFALGNFREGMIAVEGPSDCPNISKISCKYAAIFQEFLDSSALPIWNRLNNTGFWRQLTVREGRGPDHDANIDSTKVTIAEVMLIIQVCSLDVDEELMKSEFERMARSFTVGASSCYPPLPLTTLVVQDHRGICNAAPADCPLFTLPIPILDTISSIEPVTEARIHDFLCNLKFSISPTAFFQVNTHAAEKLYSLAGDWANLTPNTLLFDICCGTGTIGLTLACRVGLVVGIEMNHSAVSDAQRNADANRIMNCMFICAKAEDVMDTLLKEYLSMDQQQGTGSNKDDVKDAHVNGTHDDVDYHACLSTDSLAVSLACPGGKMTETRPSDFIESSACLLKSCTTENRETVEEDVIPKEKEGISTPHQQFEDVVAIVDPPRAGLHPVVIRALRTHPRLRRIVYISCNPETLVANAIELCTPTTEDRQKAKGNRGWRKMSNAGLARHRTKSMPHSEPFRPVRTMAVDMFPHTQHCEMVMLFER